MSLINSYELKRYLISIFTLTVVLFVIKLLIMMNIITKYVQKS